MYRSITSTCNIAPVQQALFDAAAKTAKTFSTRASASSGRSGYTAYVTGDATWLSSGV
jgi:hypothetical protein